MNKASITIRRDNEVSRVTFSALRDEGRSVRVDFDNAAVEVHNDPKVCCTFEEPTVKVCAMDVPVKELQRVLTQTSTTEETYQ
jgi:hypothetical protein